MNIRICHHDSQGLANDADILKHALNTRYPTATVDVVRYPEQCLIQPRSVSTSPVNVQFFLEHIHPAYITTATRNVFIPNPEWINHTDLEMAKSDYVDHVVAKTSSGYVSLKKRFGSKVSFWGWTSIDRLDESVWKTFDECLHIKGCSRFKNSQLVMDTWLKHPEWPLLHVVSYGNFEQNGYLEINRPFVDVAENIRLYQRKLNEAEIKTLMNRSGIHICPSQMEGFGHYINEARSCGAYVITTRGAPMSELITSEIGSLIDAQTEHEQCLSRRYVITNESFENTIEEVLKTSHHLLREKAAIGRAEFVAQRNKFEENVSIY